MASSRLLLQKAKQQCRLLGSLTSFKGGLSSARQFSADRIPGAFDWRHDRGLVKIIKDQGSGSSCYAHASATAIEYLYQIKRNRFIRVSVEDLLDNGAGRGSQQDPPGGNSLRCLYWIKENGVALEEDHPLQPDEISRIITIDDVIAVPVKKDIVLQDGIMRYGPMIVDFHASYDFCDNNGEIFYSEERDRANHSVVFTGWGTSEGGVPYWNVQSSYGTDWGDGGLAKVKRTGHPWWVPDGCLVTGCVPILKG